MGLMRQSARVFLVARPGNPCPCRQPRTTLAASAIPPNIGSAGVCDQPRGGEWVYIPVLKYLYQQNITRCTGSRAHLHICIPRAHLACRRARTPPAAPPACSSSCRGMLRSRPQGCSPRRRLGLHIQRKKCRSGQKDCCNSMQGVKPSGPPYMQESLQVTMQNPSAMVERLSTRPSNPAPATQCKHHRDRRFF